MDSTHDGCWKIFTFFRSAWYDMGGNLPELKNRKAPYDPELLQDGYSESDGSSSTIRLNPLGLLSVVWPHWKNILKNRGMNQMLGVSHGLTDGDFWETPHGAPLTYMED